MITSNKSDTCIILVTICCVAIISNYAFGDDKVLFETILNGYREAMGKLDKMSARIISKERGEGSTYKDIGMGYFVRDTVICRDISTNRGAWAGENVGYDNDGNILPKLKRMVRAVCNQDYWVSLRHHNPEQKYVPEAILYSDSEKMHTLIEGRFYSPLYGGPIEGRYNGSNHKSVANMLIESGNVSMSEKQEMINGISCYVLKATTKYGEVAAWIAPEKGYNAIKWIISKRVGQFYRSTTPAEDEFNLWEAEFEADELHEIDDVWCPFGRPEKSQISPKMLIRKYSS